MSRWKEIKDGYRKFVHDAPGKRFVNLYRLWHREQAGPLMTVVAVALGIILIAGGFLLALVPGVPGIVLGIVGIGIIAAQFRLLAKGLDRTEVWLRSLIKRFRRLFGKR